MTDVVRPDPSPGWYPDSDDAATERYWDGSRWTDARRPIEAVGQSQGFPAGQCTNGLDIAAFILALLVGPVGFVLGLIAVSKARTMGDKPSGLAIAAAIIGGIATVVGVIMAIVTAIGIASAFSSISHLPDESLLGEDSSEIETLPGGESDERADGGKGAYCEAYAAAEPALEFLMEFNLPSYPPSNSHEYTVALAPAFEDAFAAVQGMRDVTDESTDYSVTAFLASADAVRLELNEILEGGTPVMWTETDTAYSNAEIIVSQGQLDCGP